MHLAKVDSALEDGEIDDDEREMLISMINGLTAEEE